MTIICDYGKLKKKSPDNWRIELFKIHLDNLFLLITLLILVFFLTGCPKKPPHEAVEVHESINAEIENCASIYAKDQLLKLDIMLLELEEQKKKKKFKKMREMALDILPHIKLLKETVLKEKKVLRDQIDEEKKRAEENIKSALEEGALNYASNLLVKAKALFHKGEEYEEDPGCHLSKSLGFFYSSAQVAEKAKFIAIEEEKRITEQELARKLLEEKEAEVKEKPKAEITQWAVAKEENLWTISSKKEVYGNPLLWPLIFWANRSQIKDPNLIYQNQLLKIPRDFKEEDIERALEIAETHIQASEDQ